MIFYKENEETTTVTQNRPCLSHSYRDIKLRFVQTTPMYKQQETRLLPVSFNTRSVDQLKCKNSKKKNTYLKDDLIIINTKASLLHSTSVLSTLSHRPFNFVHCVLILNLYRVRHIFGAIKVKFALKLCAFFGNTSEMCSNIVFVLRV